MALKLQQQLCLCDRDGRELGQVVINRIEQERVFGHFLPAMGFKKVQDLFAEFLAAADQQLLSHLDELDERIQALGLHLAAERNTELPSIHDVQIGGGTIFFRQNLATDGEANGVATAVSFHNSVVSAETAEKSGLTV